MLPTTRKIAVNCRTQVLSSSWYCMLRRYGSLLIGSRFSILDPGSLFLDSRFSILDSRFWILDSRFSILDPRSSTLDSRFSILDPRSSTLDSRSSILGSRFSILHSRWSIETKWLYFAATLPKFSRQASIRHIVGLLGASHLRPKHSAPAFSQIEPYRQPFDHTFLER